jgi:hypothetical protein
MSALPVLRASDVEPEPAPKCPTCGNEMLAYGGSGGYICCKWKLLYRADGWFDEAGIHLRDDRLNDRRTWWRGFPERA